MREKIGKIIARVREQQRTAEANREAEYQRETARDNWVRYREFQEQEYQREKSRIAAEQKNRLTWIERLLMPVAK